MGEGISIGKEEKKEDILDNLLLFKYGDKTLKAWIDFFTIDIPKLPTTSAEVCNTIVDLNNRYQVAYNNLSILSAQCSSSERKYRMARDSLISSLLDAYKEKGINKVPAKETLETIVLNDKKNINLVKLYERYEIYLFVKSFFEDHKNKLEKVMKLFSDISYTVNASDKMNSVMK